MEVRHLRTLRELRDRGSVTAVAAALHLSPSAVSQQLAALQRGFDVPLTEQRGRHLGLTPAGERLALAGDGVIAAVARAEQAARGTDAEPGEPVTVTAFHSAALAWFPDLIAQSLADPDGPSVRCRDEDVSISEFVGLAADHDLVIAHRPPAAEPWPDGRIVSVPVLEEPIELALRRDHPLAARSTVELGDLAAEIWVAAHEGFALEPLVVQALAAGAGDRLEIAHRVNEFNVVAAIIARTGAVGLLPRHTGLPAALRDELVLRPIRGVSVTRRIDVLARPEALTRPAVREVVGRIVEIAGRRSREGEAR
ncbi:LysR family transcriptional regulator [Leucobacter zeae]|nr:LysR family transcriptional regulator [Leucobacter zeae]